MPLSICLSMKSLFLPKDPTNRMKTFPSTVCVRRRHNKKLSYCWEAVRRESMPRIAEMDVEMTN